MTDTPDNSSDATKSSNRRRRLRRFVIIFALVIAIIVGFCFVRQRQFDNEIDELITKLDELDAKWRFKELEEQYKRIPKDKNSAVLIEAVYRELTKKSPDELNEIYPKWYDLTPPVVLPEKDFAAVMKTLSKHEAALSIARKLKEYPRGRFPVVLQLDNDNDLVGVKHLPHFTQVRPVRALLELDVYSALDENRLDDAFESLLAMYHIGESVANRPTPISRLIWIANSVIAIGLLERCIAQGRVSTFHLSKWRKRLEKALNLESLFASVKGELAVAHEVFLALRRRQIGSNAIEKNFALRGPNIWEVFKSPFVRGRWRRNHRVVLETYLDVLAISRDSDAQALESLNQLFKSESLDRDRDFHERIEDCLWLVFEKIVVSEKSKYGCFQCAICGLAAEEFRLKSNRWPNDLAELVDAKLIKNIPDDLYDGKPLRFRKTKDGLVIYSIGTGEWGYTEGKLPYQGNMYDNPYQPIDYSPRLEFRLWNPDKRRQPAPPEKKPDRGFDIPPE